MNVIREYGARDESSEPFTREKAASMLLAGIEKAETLMINHAVRSLRDKLRDSDSVSFKCGSASILPNGNGLQAHIGRDTDSESGSTYSIMVGWDEAEIVGDVRVGYKESIGGRVVKEANFGSGMSSPEYTGVPNTLSIGAVRRGLNFVNSGVKTSIKNSHKLSLD